MARIDSIFKSDTKKAEQHPKRITKWIHYTKLHDNKGQYCDAPSKEAIETLADLIEADGEVLQDLLVRKIDTDEYEIVAGHKRRKACQLLVEERGKEEFSFLPCYVKNESDVRSEFRLYSTNGYHEKTEYERMHELERMKYLLENFPEEFPQIQGGRMVERLAKLLNMKKTTVGDYLTISKNLGDKGMEMFKSGTLKKSAALELSGLPEETQEKLLNQGVVKQADIKKMKEKEKEPVADMAMSTQLELPDLKNNTQRQMFLSDYQTWPVWFKVREASETYYRFDLPDGSSIVICKYHMWLSWKEEYSDENPDSIGTREYLLKPGYHYLHDCKTNTTNLIEHLKKVQKDGGRGKE